VFHDDVAVVYVDVSEPRPLTGLLFIHQIMYEHGEPRWNDTGRKNRKNSGEKSCPSAIMFTINSIWTDLGAIQGPRFSKELVGIS
jgi:hypothetical protein